MVSECTFPAWRSHHPGSWRDHIPSVRAQCGPSGSAPIGHPAVSVGLVGVRNEWELKENVAAVEWELSSEIREEIDAIFTEESVPTHVTTDQAI